MHENEKVRDPRSSRLLAIPPPLTFALTFLGASGLNLILPIRIGTEEFARGAHAVGASLLGVAIVIAVSCVWMFLSRRTTLIPFGTASRLLTSGPYQFSRNPMYLSLVLAYLGVTGMLGNWWAPILLVLPVRIMAGVVIPFEEARMKEKFGEDYLQYCKSVRRWI